ncbi:MAG: alpha/beta hydrolase [Hyphomonas sp.]|uniref:alpha/beta hydrolase fold domain-containing protein n=1 Tax=Hyphomonas sp. TaxID=87 RepID=UPI001836DFC6|nr:alpha/beta hydrolase fold domain-containing protein [Hyphomonas sp.]MBA3069420.1 alpha/beta hydrolase [Hyphomonas sp.]MBU3920290.1 alpha/beta hydrolase fold domain-containing protein [Alphaproteobacteria bacterium]MBU4063802.1 alpha/beta hydrolase fold domain-containing protein [Alphaproteobacteria bacterium]MBU4164237.1 alpha/beta hydrolase fold domain-containing protein [Alphaproteobacteria bacterium]
MSLQRFLARAFASLPGNLIVKMTGGTPITVEGRTLEPQLQLAAWNGRNAPPLSSMPAETVQEAMKAQFALLADVPSEGASVTELTIPGPDGNAIPARLYRPSAQDPRHPLIVYFHMGGGVIGDLDTCHAWCAMLALGAQAPVLSVDYRLAPQHVFPAGLNDCIAAYKWGVANAPRFGAPGGKAAVGGDSMGGNFSAIISQLMKREGGPLPALQLLIYPAIDISKDYRSKKSFAKSFPLDVDTMDWFMAQYLPAGTDTTDLRVSPGQEKDLSGLPPAVVITAGHDPLSDEGDEYAARLNAAGVPVVHKRYDSLAHAFTSFTLISPGSRAACHEIAEMVHDVFARAARASA